jgi:putative endonuclease
VTGDEASPRGDRGREAAALARRRHRSGERGEALAAGHLRSIGWEVLGTRVRVGRDEIDLLAVEPGPPRAIVVVEVRTRATSRFGTPEESVDRRKVARLYRAAAALRARGCLSDGTAIPSLTWRVDLLAVDDAPALGPDAGGVTFRHVRALEPG